VKRLPEAAAIWVSADGETETVSTGPEIRLENKRAQTHQREF